MEQPTLDRGVMVFCDGCGRPFATKEEETTCKDCQRLIKLGLEPRKIRN